MDDHANQRFDLELKRLEKRLDELVVICRQLQGKFLIPIIKVVMLRLQF